jgi:imidazolonepropionase-like amidohydrolase
MEIVYRNAAVAHGTGPDLVLDQTLVVRGRRVAWMGYDDEASPPGGDARVVDAGGATIVPGMVDAHSHTVLPGGSHWIARGADSAEELLEVAERNGDIAHRAGTRWFRDVGSPERDGRALALRVRDSWIGRHDRPYVRAAGTWVSKAGTLPPSLAVEAGDADQLVAAVEKQATDGADLIKPWTADEVARAVASATEHGLDVTAHATVLAGARAAVHGGVHCIEHGTTLDADLAADMAQRGTYLVPTLGVGASWETFSSTTTIDRFASREGRTALAERKEVAFHSVSLASRAGVTMAAGTDFGGGSLRANHMAWEVECLVEAGLEPWKALAAATWIGGELLGEETAGRITVGGPADFFLVHGDPLDDPSALWRVWQVA